MDGRCPLGDALDEACRPIVAVQVFFHLQKKEKTTVFLRTRQSVASLCDAQRRHYIKMHSLNQKKCCDPFEQHKDKISFSCKANLLLIKEGLGIRGTLWGS